MSIVAALTGIQELSDVWHVRISYEPRRHITGVFGNTTASTCNYV